MDEDVLTRGQRDLERMLEVWRIQINVGPMGPPSLEDFEPFCNENERLSAQEYIDQWSQEEEDGTHANLMARVAYIEHLQQSSKQAKEPTK